jgi:hypothetical protein
MTEPTERLEPGTRVIHTRYGWRGTVVEGPRARSLLADQREVRWDSVNRREPFIVPVARLTMDGQCE